MLGRLPWLALDRRIRAFFFLVFFDMGSQASGGSGCLHPAQQVVDVPGVDHSFERHLALGGPVAAVRLPFQLAGGVGVAVDREVAAVVDRQLTAAGGAGRGVRGGS